MEQDRFDEFYYHASCALKSIQKLKNKAMIPIGLASAHTMCLRHLYSAPDGLTRTRLVHLCDIDKAQVSRIINELSARGYVIETEDESMNYKKRIKLTPMGKGVAAEINSRIVADFEKKYGRRADKIRRLYNGMIRCNYYQFFKPVGISKKRGP